MDELWQRYRSFWIPVLIGLGVFLLGLITVHVISDDPEVENKRARDEGRAVDRLIEPSKAQRKNIPLNADALRANVETWGTRLDQAGGRDGIEYAVETALRSSLLRGLDPVAVRQGIADGANEILDLFEGDSVSASRALARYEQSRQDCLTLLRSGDPIIGFSKLLNDVWTEIKLRANRADVDLRPSAEGLGFGAVNSVTRSALPQRLLNLALIAELLDLGIRSGIRSVEDLRIEARADVDVQDRFLRQWPVTVAVRGDMAALRPLLDRLNDPERPVPLSHLSLTQPARGSPLDGIVQLQVRAASTAVRTDVSLDLNTEDDA